MASKRKPHNEDAGYIAELIFQLSGSHIVIYLAREQGIDVGADKYAVVCSKHATMTGTTSLPKARAIMKAADFCEECTACPAKPKRTKPAPRQMRWISADAHRERMEQVASMYHAKQTTP